MYVIIEHIDKFRFFHDMTVYPTMESARKVLIKRLTHRVDMSSGLKQILIRALESGTSQHEVIGNHHYIIEYNEDSITAVVESYWREEFYRMKPVNGRNPVNSNFNQKMEVFSILKLKRKSNSDDTN